MRPVSSAPGTEPNPLLRIQKRRTGITGLSVMTEHAMPLRLKISSRHIRLTTRAALVACCLGIVALAQIGGAIAAEPGGTDKPAKKSGGQELSPPIANVPVPTKRIDAGQPRQEEANLALKLEVTYVVRLLVPAGSDLTVEAFDKDGKAIASTTVKTPSTDATIPVQLDIGDGAAFPLRIDAKLESGFGHLLTGTQTIEAKTQEPVKVALGVVDAAE